VTYQPLYAERRCLVCGFWRGQHHGPGTEDKGMICPVDVTYFETVASFVPGMARYEYDRG
jgi:hypothetical protein